MSAPGDDLQARIDSSVPHAARRYDYLLGGKDNFAVDRESGDAMLAAFPSLRAWAKQNRAFMHRVAAYLAAEAGLRQFLDIGTGIPTSPNLHEIVQGIAPDARVVYADNDPIVLSHARALLTGTPQGATAYLDADLRDPAAILASPEVAAVLDLGRPVALTLIAVVHFINDDAQAYQIVRTLVDALPSGSYLAMSHVSWDHMPPDQRAQMEPLADARGRDKQEFARFFEGLDLVEPGIVSIGDWRPDPDEPPVDPAETSTYGALARIP